MKNYDMTLIIATTKSYKVLYIRAGEGVFVMQEMPTLTFVGYDVYTGNKLWTAEPQADCQPIRLLLMGQPHERLRNINLIRQTLHNRLHWTRSSAMTYTTEIYSGSKTPNRRRNLPVLYIIPRSYC